MWQWAYIVNNAHNVALQSSLSQLSISFSRTDGNATMEPDIKHLRMHAFCRAVLDTNLSSATFDPFVAGSPPTGGQFLLFCPAFPTNDFPQLFCCTEGCLRKNSLEQQLKLKMYNDQSDENSLGKSKHKTFSENSTCLVLTFPVSKLLGDLYKSITIHSTNVGTRNPLFATVLGG